MNISIEDIWKRIQHSEGEVFHLRGGKPYTYEIVGNALVPVGINRNIPRSDFEKALVRLPFENTTSLQDLQGPSYIYSILMDKRIRGGDEWGSQRKRGRA